MQYRSVVHVAAALVHFAPEFLYIPVDCNRATRREWDIKWKWYGNFIELRVQTAVSCITSSHTRICDHKFIIIHLWLQLYKLLACLLAGSILSLAADLNKSAYYANHAWAMNTARVGVSIFINRVFARPLLVCVSSHTAGLYNSKSL